MIKMEFGMYMLTRFKESIYKEFEALKLVITFLLDFSILMKKKIDKIKCSQLFQLNL